MNEAPYNSSATSGFLRAPPSHVYRKNICKSCKIITHMRMFCDLFYDLHNIDKGREIQKRQIPLAGYDKKMISVINQKKTNKNILFSLKNVAHMYYQNALLALRFWTGRQKVGKVHIFTHIITHDRETTYIGPFQNLINAFTTTTTTTTTTTRWALICRYEE